METWKPGKSLAGNGFNQAAGAREVEMDVPGAAFLPFCFVSERGEAKAKKTRKYRNRTRSPRLLPRSRGLRRRRFGWVKIRGLYSSSVIFSSKTVPI